MEGLKKYAVLKAKMLVLLLLLAVSAKADHTADLLKLLTSKNHESHNSCTLFLLYISFNYY